MRWVELIDKRTGAKIGYFGDNAVGWTEAAKALKAYEDKYGKDTVTGLRVNELKIFDRDHRITK